MPADYIFTDTYWQQSFPWWVNSNFPYWPILTAVVPGEVTKLLVGDAAALIMELTDSVTLDLGIASSATLELIVGDDP